MVIHSLYRYKQINKKMKLMICFYVVIINRLIKMIHYKLINITIDFYNLIKVLIGIVIQSYDLLNSIVTNKSSVFISKF